MVTKKSVNTPTREPFSSYDIGCCAALVSLGFKPIEIEKIGIKFLFLFEWSQGLEDSAQKYWSNELQVNAVAYFYALKNLKNRMYSS